MIGITLVFLIPVILIVLLFVAAVCKVASRADAEDDPETFQQPVVDVFNPPGPRYL